jgi:hypothetical protein
MRQNPRQAVSTNETAARIGVKLGPLFIRHFSPQRSHPADYPSEAATVKLCTTPHQQSAKKATREADRAEAPSIRTAGRRAVGSAYFLMAQSQRPAHL